MLRREVFHDRTAPRASPKPYRCVEWDFPDYVDDNAVVDGPGALVVCEVEPADVVDVNFPWIGSLHQSSELGGEYLFHGRHKHIWELAFPE